MISKIQKLAESIKDPKELALAITVWQEEQGFSLSGNGWLDDDPLYQEWGDRYSELRDKANESLGVEPDTEEAMFERLRKAGLID
ncbi:MAG: hypothetical protein ACRCYP_01760 [Alphaproteobacteria bacterium]